MDRELSDTYTVMQLDLVPCDARHETFGQFSKGYHQIKPVMCAGKCLNSNSSYLRP